MNRLRELPPYQIILLAVGVLLLVTFAAYFAVTRLTQVKPSGGAQSSVPADLARSSNQEVVKALGNFEAPANLPLASQPLRTPDPNAPSTVNPFQR